MGKREFLFSVIASVIAAFLMELTGILSLSQYLFIDVNIPVWGVFLFVSSPIVLSLIWFRKSITPAHLSLLNEKERLNDQLTLKETTLAEQKHIITSQEELMVSAKADVKQLRIELDDWERSGIKMHLPDQPLEQITNQTFGVEIVELDGKEFLNCKFNGSILKFKGIAPVRLNHIDMGDVRWVMDAPASNAFQLLGALYKTGEPELVRMVEATFDNIKGVTPKAV